MGCVHFIANWTSEDIAAEAQSFFQVLQQGFSVVGAVGVRWLVGLMGPAISLRQGCRNGACVWSVIPRCNPGCASAAL